MGVPENDTIAAQEVESAPNELRNSVASDNGIHLSEKIRDGDQALQILHSSFEPYTKEEEKKVLRKIDRRMVLLMLFINGVQFVDKNVSGVSCTSFDGDIVADNTQTISAAATYGIITEAQLVGQEFSLLISIFYIGYLVAQYPTNLLMQRYPVGKYLTINFILWGTS